MVKVVALVSGGIDSPVACWLASRAGLEVAAVYFDLYPFVGKENRSRMLKVFNVLAARIPRFSSFTIPCGDAMEEFKRSCAPRNTCIHCKRFMYRAASLLAGELGARAVVTGDLISSKASQTPQNLPVLEESCPIPVLRPLVGFEKEDVVEIARKLGTLELAFGQPSCGAVPGKPCITASLSEVLRDEEKIGFASLAERAAGKASPAS